MAPARFLTLSVAVLALTSADGRAAEGLKNPGFEDRPRGN
jgi:hypothetical protein